MLIAQKRNIAGLLAATAMITKRFTKFLAAALLVITIASPSLAQKFKASHSETLGKAPPVAADERECLIKAIAYEAGYEPADGRRAVAEVIINRMRSGTHPATICGVVFEGASRTTGCQFTFTCDGSLRHRLPFRVMEEARQIADEALSGFSAERVGGALNYHADYVLPYWAPSMHRTAKIGRHIFYRPKGERTTFPLRGPVMHQTESEIPAPAQPASFSPWGISLSKQ
ncbi:MAG: cell wall hydrolase [Novosphingobium sp.]